MKESTVATGVVIVTVDLHGKSVDLQCTRSMPACTELKTGKYVMVQLPKNRGLYDCQNVDVFPADRQDTTTGAARGRVLPESEVTGRGGEDASCIGWIQ